MVARLGSWLVINRRGRWNQLTFIWKDVCVLENHWTNSLGKQNEVVLCTGDCLKGFLTLKSIHGIEQYQFPCIAGLWASFSVLLSMRTLGDLETGQMFTGNGFKWHRLRGFRAAEAKSRPYLGSQVHIQHILHFRGISYGEKATLEIPSVAFQPLKCQTPQYRNCSPRVTEVHAKRVPFSSLIHDHFLENSKQACHSSAWSWLFCSRMQRISGKPVRSNATPFGTPMFLPFLTEWGF